MATSSLPRNPITPAAATQPRLSIATGWISRRTDSTAAMIAVIAPSMLSVAVVIVRRFSPEWLVTLRTAGW